MVNWPLASEHIFTVQSPDESAVLMQKVKMIKKVVALWFMAVLAELIWGK
jgi:hypothetical protein